MIVAVIAGFAVFIVPNYHAISAIEAQQTDYQTILANARTLQTERNALVEKYNAFTPSELTSLNTMLPNNPESVNLILELNAVASQYGMVLQNVKVNDTTDASGTTTPAATAAAANSNIGTLSIEFSVQGTYDGFTSFIKTIEKSLRIIDVQKITFSAVNQKTSTYQYTVDINTYWLKQ